MGTRREGHIDALEMCAPALLFQVEEAGVSLSLMLKLTLSLLEMLKHL